MSDATDDRIPEFLRDPGVPDSLSPGGRPGSATPPGEVKDRTTNLSQPVREGQAGGDGRSLLTLADLDALLPQLQLRGYRPRVSWQREAPTEKQLRYLEGIGISPAGFENRGLTSKVLDHFRGRRERGLASLRQLVVLIGADVQGAEHIGFEEAKRLLSERFRNRGGAA
jgi:hypothetical protein